MELDDDLEPQPDADSSGEAGAEPRTGAEQEAPEIELISFDAGSLDRWRGPKYSRGCLVIVLVLGAALVIGLFMTAHSSLEQSVWVGFDTACERSVSGLPYEMSQESRERFKTDVEAFRAYLQTLEDPYPSMGAFTSEVNLSFRDGLLNRRDVARIQQVLDDIFEQAGIRRDPEPEQPLATPTADPS